MRVPWPLDTGSVNGTVLSIRVYFIAERKTQPSAGRPIPSQNKIRKKMGNGMASQKAIFLTLEVTMVFKFRTPKHRG